MSFIPASQTYIATFPLSSIVFRVVRPCIGSDGYLSSALPRVAANRGVVFSCGWMAAMQSNSTAAYHSTRRGQNKVGPGRTLGGERGRERERDREGGRVRESRRQKGRGNRETLEPVPTRKHTDTTPHSLPSKQRRTESLGHRRKSHDSQQTTDVFWTEMKDVIGGILRFNNGG